MSTSGDSRTATTAEYAAQLIYFTLVDEPRSWRMILAVTTAEESTVKDVKDKIRREKWPEEEYCVKSVRVEWIKLFRFVIAESKTVPLEVEFPTSMDPKKWNILPIMSENVITEADVKKNANIQYIEAIVVAGEDASPFISERIRVQGTAEELSFNMVLQVPKVPTSPPSSEAAAIASGTGENENEKVLTHAIKTNGFGTTNLTFNITLQPTLPPHQPTDPQPIEDEAS